MARAAWLIAVLASSTGCELLFPGPDPIDGAPPPVDAAIDALDATDALAIDANDAPIDAAPDAPSTGCAPLRVAFDDGTGSQQDLWLAALDGSPVVAVAPSLVQDFGPTGSPRGQVAFTSARDGNFQVYVAGPDPAVGVRLAPSSLSARFPAFDHAGTRVAFAQAAILTVIDADGSHARTLDTGADATPAWSPDDRRLVVARRDPAATATRHLVIAAADGSDNPRPITAGPATQRNPSWSPQGRIAYESEEVAVSPPQIEVVDADGGNRTVVGVGTGPAWSPDGSVLAWSRGGDIVTVPAGDTAITSLSTGAAVDTQPRWSPDGTRILWIRDSGGERVVIVARADGSEPITIAGPLRQAGAAAWVGCE